MKLKIGVVFHGNPLAGGCFQQSLNATMLLAEERRGYDFLYYTPDSRNAAAGRKAGLPMRTFRFGRQERIVHKLRRHLFLNRLFERLGFFPPFDATFEKDGVDLLYFTGPSSLCLFLERLNYVLTVWDLCHRDHPEFPEVRSNFEFEAREDFLRGSLSKAVAIIADSPLGKSNLERRYGLDPERVRWISHSPAQSALSEEENNPFDPREAADVPLGAPYVFYPAQFWAHKNHHLIIDALALLRKEDGRELHAIFCGSNCGNLQIVLKMAQKAGVDDLVHYAGFVPDEHMAPHYRHSLALVMPSYFGPTNMPPLEAFLLETPVVCADLPGLHDQVGDAALVVPPDQPDRLRQAFLRLLDEPELRKNLVEKGNRRLAEFPDEDRLSTLRTIFDAYEQKSRSWNPQ